MKIIEHVCSLLYNLFLKANRFNIFYSASIFLSLSLFRGTSVSVWGKLFSNITFYLFKYIFIFSFGEGCYLLGLRTFFISFLNSFINIFKCFKALWTNSSHLTTFSHSFFDFNAGHYFPRKLIFFFPLGGVFEDYSWYVHIVITFASSSNFFFCNYQHSRSQKCTLSVCWVLCLQLGKLLGRKEKKRTK